MSDIAKRLALDLKPFKLQDSFKFYFGKWLLLSLLLTAATFFLIPVRTTFFNVTYSPLFIIENILWISISILCSRTLYLCSFPGAKFKNHVITISILLLILILLALTQHNFIHLENELLNELELKRGRCGFFISVFSIIHSTFLFKWAKSGASTSLSVSGLLVALSSSSLACILMQITCGFQNGLHLLVWHFFPLTLICFAGVITAKKILRW